MRNARKTALALVLATGVSGCSDFISGPGVTTNPNAVDQLTRPGPLYVGIQAAQVVQYEGQLGRYAAMYTQQVSGNSRQQIGYDRGTTGPGDTDTYFGAVYGSTRTVTGGGGLLDIHKMQQISRRVDDSLYIGIAKVYEAITVGLAADFWGDIPYREAADSNNLTPAFDPQLQVYADLIAQLDSAINIFLPASGPTNAGPPADGAELIYNDRGGDTDALRAVYTEVAHSLKARLYMHLAETNPANYALALAEVGPPGLNNGGPGISTPENDFLWYHDATPNGNNIWWQFSAARGDIGPGSALIEILKRRIAAGIEDDARLNFYFTPAEAGGAPTDFFGFRPGGATNLATTGGIDNGNGSPAGNYSGLGAIIDGVSGAGDFRTPMITWAETQLIGAEAALATGNAGLAQQYLDAARANRSFGSIGGLAVTFPALGSVPANLQNIMEEKYVTLFLNPEVWSDHKRTCLPSLAPAAPPNSTTPATSPIPARIPYGQTEINANPNTPTTNSAGIAVTPTGQNPNDPTAC
ncbi:MAG TPA: SusD/RagB family nutrient-binding outer membrane lipoprotein, partial [Gemmatimonadales bacterium]|nr:SusD/RagB family nutrient-binding outer membrane lipoprotein [Gemmatimonadales bacterium]